MFHMEHFNKKRGSAWLPAPNASGVLPFVGPPRITNITKLDFYVKKIF